MHGVPLKERCNPTINVVLDTSFDEKVTEILELDIDPNAGISADIIAAASAIGAIDTLAASRHKQQSLVLQQQLATAAKAGNAAEVKTLLVLDGAAPSMLQRVQAKWVTPLFIAAQDGHADVVNVLLEHTTNPNQASTDDGATPVFMAAQNNHVGCLQALLGSNADPNLVTTDDGQTPIFAAAQQGHVKAVKVLLDCNSANPNKATTDDGQTPIYAASQEGYCEVLEMLLDRNADPNVAETTAGATPLWIAANQGWVGALKVLLKYNADPTQGLTTTGETPIYAAARDGQVEILKLLLAQSTTPNQPLVTTGATPIWVAAREGRADVLKVLLEHPYCDEGVDIDLARTDTGSNPAFVALREGTERHAECLKILLEHKADPNWTYSKSGISLMKKAASAGKFEFLKLLQMYGGNSIVRSEYATKESAPAAVLVDRTQRKAVLIATIKRGKPADLKIATLLLERGADPNQAVRFKWGGQLIETTPLVVAVERGLLTFVKLLLHHGADPNEKHRLPSGEQTPSPLQLAQTYNHTEIAALLQLVGAAV